MKLRAFLLGAFCVTVFSISASAQTDTAKKQWPKNDTLNKPMKKDKTWDKPMKDTTWKPKKDTAWRRDTLPANKQN